MKTSSHNLNHHSSYSTPARGNDSSRPLSHIPGDIYFEIFGYLEPSEEMSRSEYKVLMGNLSLVCRFFHITALPQMFKSIVFSGESRTSKCLSFFKAILEGDAVACSLSSHVKECSFLTWGDFDEDTKRINQDLLAKYGEAITQMSHLETVNLWDVPVDNRFLTSICNTKYLKTLTIEMCNLRDDLTADDIRMLTRLDLTSFEVDDMSSRGFSPHIMSAPLTSMHLVDMQTNSWNLAIDILSQPEHFLSLQNLELFSVEDVDLLYGLLKSFSHLTTLKIHSIIVDPDYSGSPSVLSKTCIPHLRVLMCPPSLTVELVPGRPVVELSLSGCAVVEDSHGHAPVIPRMNLNHVHLLLASTSSFRVLDIPGNLYLCCQFNEFFPLVEELRLDFVHPNFKDFPWPLLSDRDDLWALFHDRKPSPAIRQLKIKTAYVFQDTFLWNLEVQHDMVSTFLAAAFPSMDLFTMFYCVKWRRRESSNEWRAFVPHDMCEEVYGIVTGDGAYKPATLKDYNGCYEAARILGEAMLE